MNKGVDITMFCQPTKNKLKIFELLKLFMTYTLIICELQNCTHIRSYDSGPLKLKFTGIKIYLFDATI